MCSKCVTNLVFSIILTVLFVILLILIALIITHPRSFVVPSCKLNEDNYGVCVNSSLCVSDRNFFINPECSRYDEFKCCSIDDIITESERRFVQHKNYKFLNTAYCGASDDADNGHFDHVVDLGFENRNGEVNFTCSGSLINRHFILTSAQCASNQLSVISLRRNRNCLENDKECSDIRDFEIIVHPQFDKMNLTNDIALVKLTRPVKVKGHKITPVCLPFGVEKVPSSLDGITLDTDQFESNFVSLLDCNERIRSNRRQESNKMKPLYEDSQFCAQIRGTSHICNGDLGASLQKATLIRAKNRIVQYGIYSYDTKSCRQPEIYTKLHYYLDWILDIVDS